MEVTGHVSTAEYRDLITVRRPLSNFDSLYVRVDMLSRVPAAHVGKLCHGDSIREHASLEIRVARHEQALAQTMRTRSMETKIRPR